MKKLLIIIGLIVIILVGSVLWSRSLQKNDTDMISRNGIHYHPELLIYVQGVKQEIPQNIGLGSTHNPVHTHEDLPLIHLEFSGIVRKSDTTLGQFFKVWGKDIRSFGSNMTMTVNGVENTEYENYQMHDKDKIELHYN